MVQNKRSSILHNMTNLRKLLGNQENNCTFVVHKWKTGNGQDYNQKGKQ